MASAVRIVSDPETETKPEGWTRFVCFSDTHGLHDKISCKYPADVLLHAGDFSNTGELEQIESLSRWLASYPAEHKVIIAGNHDVTFDAKWYAVPQNQARFHRPDQRERYAVATCKAALTGCTYLEDAATEVCGYTIYGSPWQPWFCDWAFNSTAEELKEAWAKIPAQVDVLMTHGPPHGFGDLCSHGARVGCEELLRVIKRRAVPVHISGHIHEGYGVTRDEGTVYVNASTCTLRYAPTNPPIVFDLPPVAELRQAAAEVPPGEGAPPAARDCEAV